MKRKQMTEDNEKKKRGFALLSPERRAEIAAMGGRSGRPENRFFAKNPDAASAAGKVGGAAIREKAKAQTKQEEASDEEGDR